MNFLEISIHKFRKDKTVSTIFHRSTISVVFKLFYGSKNKHSNDCNILQKNNLILLINVMNHNS